MESLNGPVVPVERITCDLIADVLGGGLPLGNSILLGGLPGSGKSTLLMQIAHSVAMQGHQVLYASKEESVAQLRARAQRVCGLDLPPTLLATEPNGIEDLVAKIKENEPALFIADSLQAITGRTTPSALARVTSRLNQLTKDLHCCGLIIGHSVKTGAIAGPMEVQHEVDGVATLRLHGLGRGRLFSLGKTRFCKPDRVMLEMTDRGLVIAKNPAELLAKIDTEPQPGKAWCAVINRGEVELVEVDVSVRLNAAKRRHLVGVDGSRTKALISYAERMTSVDLEAAEVLVQVSGENPPKDPGLDAAILWGLVSAALERPVPRQCFIGELSHTDGLFRPVPEMYERLLFNARCGINPTIVPVAHPEVPAGHQITCLQAVQLLDYLDQVSPPTKKLRAVR